MTEQNVLKLEDWNKLNNALYKLYLAANTNEEESNIESQFLKLNAPMIMKKAMSINISKYKGILDVEDVLQTVKLVYLETLKKIKEDGYTVYRIDIYKIVENLVKERLATEYGIGGLKISYATQKRHMRNGVTLPCVESVNTCEEGNDETGIEKRKSAMISDGLSTEDVVLDYLTASIIKDGLNEAFGGLSDIERAVVCMRSLHAKQDDDMKWEKIGEECGLSTTTARRKYFAAIDKMKKVCIKLELTECL